ncbi:catalase-related domain-containing protein [Clostridium algidicarnis]|uniref:catalase-related domain-containing protein n=1 Tax=Clostridium algidicarnis TaxID=37659 RepID=UPI001C0C641C|nr:catalase-related domain-containing protein [Clostridium algidicarnis]MBU3195985.1 hypothetical protein [Clostridium algidicarnis]MBU3209021.1 hypothetical protein [Clostridium algidicarnis]MBU3228743.1 hypothetical protein [Clostridium algidicarnis]MBU3252287.1 hypothetical protein [Clostridium algidicarnis]
MRSEIENPDDFTQAGEKYESLSTLGKKNLVNNIVSGLVHAKDEIQNSVLRHLQMALPVFAESLWHCMKTF